VVESTVDWERCVVCHKLFRIKELKTMNKTLDGFLCVDCDKKKNGGTGLK
jgi:hypothetical protein